MFNLVVYINLIEKSLSIYKVSSKVSSLENLNIFIYLKSHPYFRYYILYL